MFLTDFHTHSTFSDGKLSIPELIDFYGTRGFGALAITDHLCETSTVVGRFARYLEQTLTRATFPLYVEILKSESRRAWTKYGMVVIPGVEFSKNSVSNHHSAHVLGLGLTQFMSADADARDLARSIRRAGGLAIAAHPVSTRKIEKQTYHLFDRREELAGEFDAWEVASGPHLFDEILHSPLPKIANSDFHVPEDIAAWKTVLDCPKNPSAILAAIREQDLGFQYFKGDESKKEAIDDVRGWVDVNDLGPSGDTDDLRHFLDLTSYRILPSSPGRTLWPLPCVRPEASQRR